MIKKSDAIILGGNVFALYAGIHLEKNGINVTIVEHDLFRSMINMGPMFFIKFNGGIMEKINEKSLSIYKEIMRKDWNGDFIWPIDLYYELKKKFNGVVLNHVSFNDFSSNGNKITGIVTNLGTIETELVIFMDHTFLKFLSPHFNNLLDYNLFDYGNALLQLNEKFKVSMFDEDIIFSDGKLAFLSAPYVNKRFDFLKDLFYRAERIYPGLIDSTIIRFWRNSHDQFKDLKPRMGRIFFSNGYFMAGYSRYGISAGLELSRLLIQFALGKPMDFDIKEISLIQ